MRRNDIEIGAVYVAKVSGRLVPVRIQGSGTGGGFVALNLHTGRRLRLRSAARLRYQVVRCRRCQRWTEFVDQGFCLRCRELPPAAVGEEVAG